MQPEDPENESLFFTALREVLKKCSDRGISVDIIWGSYTHALLKKSLLVDVAHYHEGGFSMGFPIEGNLLGIQAQFVTRFVESMLKNLSRFGELWDKWIAPRLSLNSHNVVVFDKVDVKIYKDTRTLLTAEIKFEWLHMGCKFSKEEGGNGLYAWPRESSSTTVGRVVTSCANLIGICIPVTQDFLRQTEVNHAPFSGLSLVEPSQEGEEGKYFLHQKEFNQIPFDDLPKGFLPEETVYEEWTNALLKR